MVSSTGGLNSPLPFPSILLRRWGPFRSRCSVSPNVIQPLPFDLARARAELLAFIHETKSSNDPQSEHHQH